MRFLADIGVSITTVAALRQADHAAVHLRDEGLATLADWQIVAKAVAESRIVLTFDLDFGDILAIARTDTPSVIIFRLRDQTPAAVNPRLFGSSTSAPRNWPAERSLSLRTTASVFADFRSGGDVSGPAAS